MGSEASGACFFEVVLIDSVGSVRNRSAWMES